MRVTEFKDPPRSASVMPTDTADASRASTQAALAESASAKTPPDFPPNYRVRFAVALASQYVREGRGTPEISDFGRYSSPLGLRNSICVRYPAGVLGGHSADEPTFPRHLLIYSTPDLLQRGHIEFRKKDFGFLAPCPGGMQHYAELEQVADKLRAGRARGDNSCVVRDDAQARDTIKW